MLTCKSPRKVMLVAWHLGRQVLPKHSSKFSRHDFTLPQLFACLVVREHQNKSYRGIEALLSDARHWCRAIGMKRVPDHNTLCRAFHAILGQRTADRMLDRLALWFAILQALGSTLAVDSSLYDTHYRSRHYEMRCRHYKSSDKRTVCAKRSRSAKRTPKLTIGADTRSHVILAARARTGMGSDCRDFVPLVRGAHRRHRNMKLLLADAGFDSHAHHQLLREQLHVRSLIKSGVGRRSSKEPSSRYRRMMKRQLSGPQRGKPYGQRAQAETVNSMLKRNLGDSLRARSPQARRNEQLLRAITHNLMLPSRYTEGRDRARPTPLKYPDAESSLAMQARAARDIVQIAVQKGTCHGTRIRLRCDQRRAPSRRVR
jgi:hypothetical protein